MNHSKNITNFIFLLIIILSAIIRFLWLDHFPPSLYTDEINQGYNAYSILLTGRDEHGVFLPPSLRSFGDWKPPLPAYLMIPAIFILGLTEVTVRLPSAILGIGTIILSFYLVRELFRDCHEATFIALLTSFFLTISPWHILQSRAAMLVMVGLFFLELGVFLFIKGIKKNNLLYLSSLSFAFSIYAYYGLRIVTPLILLVLVFFCRGKIKLFSKEVILSVVLGVIIFLPLVLAFRYQPDVIFGRAKTVSIFYDQGVKLRQWELIAQDGSNYPPFLARFFHNNLYMYGRNIIQRFLSHFDGRFLFLLGDQSPPFQIPNMGILYVIDAIFILPGIIILYRQKYFYRNFIILWLLISIIPASLTFMTPSSNRTFTAVVPFMIVFSVGLIHLLKFCTFSKYQIHSYAESPGHSPGRSNFGTSNVPATFDCGVTPSRWPNGLLEGGLIIAKVQNFRYPWRFVVISIISILYVLSFAYFLHQYFIVLPHDHADWWSYGFKETVEHIKTIEKNYENIVMPDLFGMPYIYYLFYNKYPPKRYQNEAMRSYVADQFGYEHVESFGRYLFPNKEDWEKLKEDKLSNSLYVLPASEVFLNGKLEKVVSYPNGKEAFKIFTYE